MERVQRYQKTPVIDYPERTWPNQELQNAPRFCSVDLRDGNQALIDPMVVSEKMEYYDMLMQLGFREIEIGYPAASQIELEFLRQLVERKKIPDDLWIQVLTQCREDLIDKTFEAIEGVEHVIFHIYNSISALQRDVVFHKDKEEIKKIAVDAALLVKKKAKSFPGKIILEYSAESFTGTEIEYALEVCTAVQKAWGATKENPIIINLPATVEMSMPNVYADRIEWMSRHFEDRDSIILSVHPHNDRGTAVAAAELALLAGADRVEGTLFGNGERTGNVDMLTIAYNLFSQGIDPGLHLEHVSEIIDVYERCCKMNVSERHPYAGKLVFTAFSGSHQDAINKGIHAMEERGNKHWEVPYLPIDPADIGRVYEPIVRINSQSGKGGVAYIMDTYFGYKLPKGLYKEFATIIQKRSEESNSEVSPQEIMSLFRENYLDKKEPLHFKKLHVRDLSESEDMDFDTQIELSYTIHGQEHSFEAVGNGPIDAIMRGLRHSLDLNIKIYDYEEHALQGGANAQAAAYIHLLSGDDGRVAYGVGLSSNITRASVRAIFSAINRLELIK